MIGEPARKYREKSTEKVAGSADFGHGDQGKVSVAYQVKGQPGEQEVTHVVVAKLGNDGAPGGTLQKNSCIIRRSCFVQMNGRFRRGHPGKPGDKPAQTEYSEKYEESPPAEFGDQ